MRIVPTLAHGQDAEQDIVSALVIAVVGPETPQMAGRIDAPRHMMNEEHTNQAAPDQSSPDARPTLRDNAAQNGRYHQAQQHPQREEKACDPQSAAGAEIVNVAI